MTYTVSGGTLNPTPSLTHSRSVRGFIHDVFWDSTDRSGMWTWRCLAWVSLKSLGKGGLTSWSTISCIVYAYAYAYKLPPFRK